MNASPGQMGHVESLASMVESTARDLRAKNIEHKHLFEAAKYMRTESIPIPLDSTTTYVNILRGSLVLSEQNRRALCPDPHSSHAAEVKLTLRLNEYEHEPDQEWLYINGQKIIQFISWDGDDVQDYAVERAIETAKALGVGLTICCYCGVFDEDDNHVELCTQLIYNYDELTSATPLKTLRALTSAIEEPS